MKTLITPQQVIRHAFGGHPTLPLDAVSEGDIAAAEARYLVPVLGEALYERLIEGAYEEFRRDYLVCCTALFTRCMVQPRLDLRTNALGTLAPKSDQGTAPDMAGPASIAPQPAQRGGDPAATRRASPRNTPRILPRV